MAEKRSEPRYMCSELVNILIRHEDQTEQEAIANLEDISRSGACVQLDEAVRLGADIEIVCSTCRFKGKVRNCRYAGSRYEPAHLLLIETGLAYVDALADAPEENTGTMRAGSSPE